MAKALRRCPTQPGMGKFLVKNNQVPIFRNFLVVKFQLESDIVPSNKELFPNPELSLGE